MAALRPELRTLLTEVISAAADTKGVLGRGGIDKKRWRKTVLARMGKDHKLEHKDISGVCVDEFYRLQIERFIRSSKGSRVESLTEMEQIKTSLKKKNRIVQLRADDGSYITKRESACTIAELDRLAEFYEERIIGDTRRAAFYRRLAGQMRLAGFADSDPLSKFLAA